MTTQVAITALGLVTPFGCGVDTYWNALLDGRIALAAPEDPIAFGGGGEPVGQVPAAAFPPTPTTDRPEVAKRRALLRAALAEALAVRGLDRLPPDAWLFLVGHLDSLRDPGPPDAAAFLDVRPDRDLVHPATTVVGTSHACASALFGLQLAREALRGGLTPLAVVAGVAVLNRFIYASMRTCRAVSPTAARPFDVRRSGISLGEGAGAVVLEPAAADAELLLAGAATRVSGASSYASDEHEVLDCMRAALRDAGHRPPPYVHAHATGTVQGDAAELAALSALARDGAGEVLAGSHKGAVGHLLQASGFPGVAAAVQVLRTGVVPPTPRLDEPESAERVTLPTAPLALGRPPGCVLVNGFGFGGNNASVVITTSGSAGSWS
jgi:3-oxoacyl-[acyl-carrier-protein] synthase II